MPELPEVETTRRGVREAIVGRAITAFDLREPRLRWRVDPTLVHELVGQRIHDVRRRAKYLLIDLDRGSLIAHLGMSGSLRVMPAGSPRLLHDHYDLVLDSGQCLRFNDPRRFGSLLWCTGPVDEHPLLAALGPEPLEDGFTAELLATRAKRRKVAVKLFLMDQHVVVGVGNIYASEALFRAGVRPRRAAGRIKAVEWQRIVESIRQVLGEAIRAGRHDAARLRERGRHARLLPPAAVRLRAGRRACRRCETPIRHLVQGQRSTYFCPECQK